jgi:hemerythrin-like domain-containing protein
MGSQKAFRQDAGKGATMKPRGQLMIEHRLIEKLLGAAARLAGGITQETYDPVLIDTIVDFIKTYADRTHHGKEEDILFHKLSERKVQGDDLTVMKELIDEHRQAREKVKAITELNERYRNGDTKVVLQIKEIILWLADFYPVHIAKEDKDFFPKSEKYFNDEELVAMLEDFWTFDRQMIHEKYQGILKGITGKSAG